MKSRTINMLFLLAVLACTGMKGRAQIVTANPLEWMALAEGNELIDGQMESQIKGQTQTAMLQNTIASEFNQIHGWQEKFIS